jgi:hypothetical protein
MLPLSCSHSGDRGRGRGRGRGRDEDKEWVPVTKLGRLVKDDKIKSLEEIYSFSMRIQECQIVEKFLGDKLKDEVSRFLQPSCKIHTAAGAYQTLTPMKC